MGKTLRLPLHDAHQPPESLRTTIGSSAKATSSVEMQPWSEPAANVPGLVAMLAVAVAFVVTLITTYRRCSSGQAMLLREDVHEQTRRLVAHRCALRCGYHAVPLEQGCDSFGATTTLAKLRRGDAL